MPLRILFLILAFLVFANLIIITVSFLFNTNLYKTHGKLILNFFIVIALLIVILYSILPFVNV